MLMSSLDLPKIISQDLHIGFHTEVQNSFCLDNLSCLFSPVSIHGFFGLCYFQHKQGEEIRWVFFWSSIFLSELGNNIEIHGWFSHVTAVTGNPQIPEEKSEKVYYAQLFNIIVLDKGKGKSESKSRKVKEGKREERQRKQCWEQGKNKTKKGASFVKSKCSYITQCTEGAGESGQLCSHSFAIENCHQRGALPQPSHR